MKKIILSLAFLLTSSLLSGCSGEFPTDLGIQKNGKALKKCPESPNCVVSFYKKQDPDHYLEPIETTHSPQEAKENMVDLIEDTPRTKIIKNEEDYLRVEVTSAIFGFVDDVEFYFADAGKIHFRSASRLGHSDMGVNKDRIETIRFRYQQRDY